MHERNVHDVCARLQRRVRRSRQRSGELRCVRERVRVGRLVQERIVRLHVTLVFVIGCSSKAEPSTSPPIADMYDAQSASDAAIDVTDANDAASAVRTCDADCPLVTGGTFARKYAVVDGGVIAENAPASVTSFALDEYEVTVGRFRAFVTAWNGGYVPPAGSGKHVHIAGGEGLANVVGGRETGWNPSDDASIAPTNDHLACDANLATWTPSSGARESSPINCVSFWEARAFCIWSGGFLPSEAEWEYAAAGGDEQRAFPWGAIDPGNANAYAIYDCNYPFGSGTCLGGAAPVGTAALGAGRWGQLDLAGNLNEWTLDSFGDYATPCIDCARIDDSSFRVTRGGYFSNDVEYISPTSRSTATPASRSPCLGFRCAYAP
jgi:formylglycine-generating enzyme required for sulfatase activity